MNTLEVDILIVDDTPENITLLSDVLAPLGCRLKVATSGERALQIVERQCPDLILLDVMMPGLDGFETCRRLKAAPATRDVPVIFVTARGEDVAAGFDAGGADYILKPFQSVEVRARVAHQLERRRLFQELKALNAQLEEKVRERTAELVLANHQLRKEVNERRFMQDRLSYLATHDFVTRVHNRSALDQRVCELLARRQRERIDAALLVLDIDQFRLVNDTCGCVAGDELLRMVADHIGTLIRPGDFLARLGADHFAIVLQDLRGIDDAVQLAESIAHRGDAFEFSWDGRSFRLAMTIAVVPITDDAVSFEQLMLMGDDTVQVAKRDGRGLVRVYQGENTELQQHRDTVNWALVLVDALRDNHLRIHFQRLEPVHASVQGQMHIELLMRLWDPQTQSLVYPGRFIPPAERFQLINELDRWMLREAIGFLGLHREQLRPLHRVSINLSAVTLRDATMAAWVEQLLGTHRVPPSLVCFEITETEAIDNVDTAQRFMRSLSAIGCQFAMDDFGSGYASYRYLRELPFDLLKIDGIFVRDIDVDPSHAAMVTSMVEMARLMDKPVIAECVENGEVLSCLQDMGVEWVQGFHCHRPEALTVEALLRAARRLAEDDTATAQNVRVKG